MKNPTNGEEDSLHFELFGLTFPIRKKLLISLVFKVWLGLALLLLVSVVLFGYEMTDADIPGGLISGILLAYLIHLFYD